MARAPAGDSHRLQVDYKGYEKGLEDEKLLV